VINQLSPADVSAIDVIGWDSKPHSAPGPTGVALLAATSPLHKAASAGGLNPGVSLVNVHQVGGSTTDSYGYTLGGPDAAAFTVAMSGNTVRVSVAGMGANGAAEGKAYSLTVTANDLTNGGSSPADPFQFVVGSSGSDTISVAALTGSTGPSTPAFIYGLGGDDTIDGSGMTGQLWFDGGAGADVVTGGSGPNTYLYGTIADSTPASKDVITDFHTTSDRIDLSGVSTSLKYAGGLSGPSLAAHSVGYQESGGNTFVYANTGATAVSLSSANMEMELQGAVALTPKNFTL
jgi:hypothetical protein